MRFREVVALIIFALTYFVIATGKLPRLRLDRAGAALAGAIAMVLAGAISRRQALDAVDFPTLALLLGMMIVVANLRLSGAFTLVADAVLSRARCGLGLLAITIAAAGLLAAFFINYVVCLTLAPILVMAARMLGAPPKPFLLALATASNIGSAATITGNPQNMIVAGYAHLTYTDFARRLAPIAAAGLIIDYVVIAVAYRDQLTTFRRADTTVLRRPHMSRPLMLRSVAITLGVLVCFTLGLSDLFGRTGGGSAFTFTRRIKPERVYSLIDWTMLLMFAGLFIVVAGAQVPAFKTTLSVASAHGG
jgi:Na+/H+ antiporter NhaD/arsenite permease-like protein